MTETTPNNTQSLVWRVWPLIISPWMRYWVIVAIGAVALFYGLLQQLNALIVVVLWSTAVCAHLVPELHISGSQLARRATRSERRLRVMSMPIWAFLISGWCAIGIGGNIVAIRSTPWWALIAGALGVVLWSSMVAVFGYMGRLRQRGDRRLREHNFELCLECEYVLHHLPEDGHCPECGRPYTLEITRAMWRTPDSQRDGRRGLRRVRL